MADPSLQSGYIKALRILYTAMLAGQVLFFLIVFALQWSNMLYNNTELTAVFIYLAPAVSLFSILFSSRYFRKKLPAAAAAPYLSLKLDEYRKLYIMRCAIMEGGTIFCIIMYFITGHSLMLACSFAGIVMFAGLRPAKEKIIQELELSSEEIKIFES